MANRPTYSLRGARIDFNELRMQSRRSDADRRRPYDEVEDTVETQELIGGYTPVVAPDEPPAKVSAPKTETKLTTPPPSPPTAPKPAPVVDKAETKSETTEESAKDTK